MANDNRVWCPGGKAPRLHGPFLTIRKGTGGVVISNELDRRLKRPTWVALNIRNANALELTIADNEHPNALYVARYNYGGRMAAIKIGDIGTKRWLLSIGYQEGQRVNLIEISPGVWAEDK